MLVMMASCRFLYSQLRSTQKIKYILNSGMVYVLTKRGTELQKNNAHVEFAFFSGCKGLF